MFQRFLLKNMQEWQKRASRKPLIIRGARQVGKTTLIRNFGQGFESFVEINLEKDAALGLFQVVGNAQDLLRTIEGFSGKRIIPGKTLLFIDEIQNSNIAIQMLRYFYEECPELHVIAAGSLLEVRMKKEGWSFPVGRVEFLYLFAATYPEFLEALGETVLLEMLSQAFQKPLPLPLHEKATDLLVQYLIVGGMPAAIQTYIETKSFLEVHRQHEILLTTLKEDFQKYATKGEVTYLKAVWDQLPYKMGQRIQYTGFGISPSQAVGHALDILHEAMLAERIYPTIHLNPPLLKKEKAAPKILALDVGMSLFQLKVTPLQVKDRLLRPEYEGGLWETFVAQELMALQTTHRDPLYFWVREEKGASSELDFLILMGDKLMPIEVKSGSHGALKSLHQFLARQGGNIAIRFYNGLPADDQMTVTLPDQKKIQYRLISLPLYLVHWTTSLVNG
ncbi:MAG: ATP-binding protein [Deltaproteobacteria bacterium]|nr:MAG: ATP-binding protein [Deltaproteobacteria bacterium]